MTALLHRAESRLGVPRQLMQPLSPVTGDFSEREMALLRLLASSLSQREIGNTLFISFNTVKTHSKNIFRKLGVASRAEAVARARELDLIR